MEYQQDCPLTDGKMVTARKLAEEAVLKVMNQSEIKLNAVWLEATGCSGNIISFLNGDNPNAYEILTSIINLTFSNTMMGDEGEAAYDKFLETMNTDFVLLIDGAISTKDNGIYTIVANYHGKRITAYEAIQEAGAKAKFVVAVGTCASYGGISAARPNPTGCRSVREILNRSVICLPCCPCHPDWLIGTIAHLVIYGMPELDLDGRPIVFYGTTIHDNCTRRGFFDAGEFASSYGEAGCMFHLGCRGPVTKTDCPRRKWNGYVNWPIENNTTCIGCAQQYFPDGMEPFLRF